MQVGAADGAPGQHVGGAVEHHRHQCRQQPRATMAILAPDVDHQQHAGGEVKHGGDENDCHRPSVAGPVADDAGTARIIRGPQRSAASLSMFESLTQRLSGTIERLRGRGRLTEENIRESLREVRIALLEADVALPVVQALIERIKVRAVGQEVLKSLTPGQALIKVVRDEMTTVMGSQANDLNLNVPAPAVILMAGLQGAGKTTTVGKLAKHLKDKRKKKVMVVSADVYRPAAIAQLETLAQQVDVLFFPSTADQKPEAI